MRQINKQKRKKKLKNKPNKKNSAKQERLVHFTKPKPKLDAPSSPISHLCDQSRSIFLINQKKLSAHYRHQRKKKFIIINKKQKKCVYSYTQSTQKQLKIYKIINQYIQDLF
ncbi:hypothetical protein TTHERM_000836592 (macronuclear) [Tetrahymena thermophila SB210]|uniref:Uncharacterized protein n=1 Tax=Tetrahymena thermophila (strain SB210) TaxID=312017 RepID=W7X1Y6_TETTS|nr:hypothetical protein TTHERM_000836592 [Tetrahymena thermophila SB210]EWS71647.1 hypothetical protein TTHERM_000836592 [Tetrahymena thermophila SB210]|eukprot:XP_012655807.1 hypothetical protein TTHERM_000836592 [Tetrahymena thermophila SB210]